MQNWQFRASEPPKQGSLEIGKMTMTKKRKPSGRQKPSVNVMTVKCAFCDGTGKDPFKLLSKLSICPVCQGRKMVQVERPTVACAYCHGTGKQPHGRLTCSPCKGTGLITLAGPTAKCLQCGGLGRMIESDLPCSLCRGTGLVAEKPGPQGRSKRTASKSSVGSKT